MTSSRQRIMVQVADPQWTQEALYYACILARKGFNEVAIVKMLGPPHIGPLGTPLGYRVLNDQDQIELKNYEATVEDYGVACSSFVFQYFTLAEAIVEAAEYLHADMVFATLPKGLLPFWREFQLYRLRHRLVLQQRVLVERQSILPHNSDT